MKIHHIGYLVRKIDIAKNTFLQLGYTVTQDTIYDEIRKVNICFIEKDGYLIELVSPIEKDSVVGKLIKRYNNSPYHICYVCDDFDRKVSELCANGYLKIGEAEIAPAINNKRVVFLMNATIGMIEILES